MPKNEKLLNEAVETLENEIEQICRMPPAEDSSELEQLSQAIYVWPEGQSFGAPATAALLRGKMDHFLQDKTKRIAVILGNPGAGKTAFAKNWLSTLLAAKRENQREDRNLFLPCFIALSSIGNVIGLMQNGEDLLAYYLEKKLNLSTACVKQVKQYLPLIVFLDGYDEITYFGNLYQDNRWDEWRSVKFVNQHET
jgi:predicted NACHT family NTPase